LPIFFGGYQKTHNKKFTKITILPVNLSRAAVFLQPNHPFELRSFPLPKLFDGEAIVKVSCCTLCGSDLHTFRGHRQASCPTILGHEIIGHVEQIASELKDVNGQTIEIGDRVSWSIAASCGKCLNCQNGLSQKCDQLFKYGHEPIGDQRPLTGGLAEYCQLVRGTAVIKLPDSISDWVASPANCATATVAAAIRIAGDCQDKTIVIHGAGMLGLTAAAMAKHLGARSIIVSDLVPMRLELAKQFGATSAFNVVDNSLHANVMEQTDGRGAEIVLEMSGANAAI